jgi:hypothetical protein
MPIDAVLPLVAADAERFERLLLPTLERFFAGLGTCRVVMPDAQVAAHAERFAAHERVAVIAESAVAPAVTDLREHIERVGEDTQAGAGWFVQQVVKLAAADHVATPFYLTLDADVLVVREVAEEDLVRDGRARAVVYEIDAHSGWYWWAEQVLGFPRQGAEAGRTHGVTPALLSVEGVRALCAYLRERPDPPGAAGLGAGGRGCSYDLVRLLPWTEYTIYYSFLDHHGLFDRLHFVSEHETYGNNAWSPEQVERWDAEASFAADAPFWFSVVQSNTGADVEEVARRIAPFAGG